MLTYTYVSKGTFALMEKPKPVLQHERDAIVKVTLASICSSDLHIKHGSVPRAVPGITVGHEMVGIVEEVGSAVTNVKPGDRVTVNVETFCGECFFCKKGFVNNCTDQNGGWALGCRIDGGQAEYVRVPFADQGLNQDPGRRYRPAGTAGGRCACHRLLGGAHFGDHPGGYRADFGRRADRHLHAAVRHAAQPQAHHRL